MEKRRLETRWKGDQQGRDCGATGFRVGPGPGRVRPHQPSKLPISGYSRGRKQPEGADNEPPPQELRLQARRWRLPGPARGRLAAPGRSRRPGRGEGRRKSDGPRPGLSAHLPQARKGPRPSEEPPAELPASSGAAPSKRATRGREGREREAGREEEPRWNVAAVIARPGGSRAPRAPGREGREPSAMATAQARGEAEQPPPLRVATTLGEGYGAERGGVGPKQGAPRGGDGHRLPVGGLTRGLLGVVVWRCVPLISATPQPRTPQPPAFFGYSLY